MHERERLANAGWGFAPVYLGQQKTGPGSHKVTRAQRELDGPDACSLAAAAGFAPGRNFFFSAATTSKNSSARRAGFGSTHLGSRGARSCRGFLQCSWVFAGAACRSLG